MGYFVIGMSISCVLLAFYARVANDMYRHQRLPLFCQIHRQLFDVFIVITCYSNLSQVLRSYF